MCRRLRHIRCRIYAAVMQGQCSAATAAERVLGAADALYEVHAAFQTCIPYYPAAAETCKEIEDFILELQQTFTAPQRFNVAKLIEKGAV